MGQGFCASSILCASFSRKSQIKAMAQRYYIGLMSGTSMDGVDAALVSFSHQKIQLIATHAIKMPSEIKSALEALVRSELISLKTLGELDRQLGELFSDAVLALLKNAAVSTEKITAIGSHGQTIYHSPQGQHPFTLQIGDPNVIAARTQITTVADFRRRDVALGGQGAPLTPAFHAYLFGDQEAGIGDQFVLNLGGIANITYIPADKSHAVIGFDTGPANTLLDRWCEKNTGKLFDENGDWARSGKLNDALLTMLLSDSYFQKPFPKSTGREYFNLTWLEKYLPPNMKPANVQATLVELTARSIINAIKKYFSSGEILICGGGVQNNFLLNRLKELAHPLTVHSTAEFGVDPAWVEALAFAWLAKQTLDKKTGNLTAVTGAKRSTILGGVYYT